MKVAFFDLDGTLFPGTTEGAWAQLLAEEGHLDFGPFHQFRADYLAGVLDVAAYNRWQNEPYARLELAELERLRDRLVRERVLPHIPEAAHRLIQRERGHGHRLVLATAASDFLCAPISLGLGFDDLVATPLLWSDGRPTAQLADEPCYQEGKLRRAVRYLAERGASVQALEEAAFYSDSFNDLPLLSAVGRAVVVDPDARLHAEAVARHWPVLWIHGEAPRPGAPG